MDKPQDISLYFKLIQIKSQVNIYKTISLFKENFLYNLYPKHLIMKLFNHFQGFLITF